MDVPERLLHDLANAPIIEERLIDATMLAGYRVRSPRPFRTKPTKAELNVLRCASHGMTDKMTADTLGVSIHTVKTQVRTAMAVLAAKNKMHAVAIAMRSGYLH